MASFSSQLSFFFLLVLFLSPQIQAREGKFFSLHKAESPVPIITPTQAPIAAPTQEPAAAPESGTTIPSGPAPEPEFLDNGEGYGLYGRDSSDQYSQTKETPTTPTTTTTTFGNELLNEDFNEKSYKTGYPHTNFHSNEEYTKNYNSEEYKNNDNSEYTKNYNSEEYKNNNDNNEEYTKNYNRETEEYKSNYNNGYSNNFNNNNGNEYYNNNNYGNGYGGKREGMSDTRFMENGKYYHNVNSENDQNYKLNGYESAGRGSTENYGQFQNEFDTVEEYEKQQEGQGYTP